MVIALIICLFSLAQVLIALALLLRFLPALVKFARLCLRGFLILSFRLYRLLLKPIAPVVQRYVGVDILSGMARVVATLLLSLVLGFVLLLVMQWPVAIWNIGLFALHGLLVGLAWDEMEHPSDLRMGVNSQ